MEDDIERLEKVFGKVSVEDGRYDVYASAKVYPNLIKVFVPHEPYKKNVPFLEPVKEDDDDVEDYASRIKDSQQIAEDNLARSLRRTKTLITDYTLCNEFDLFATFTFSPEKADRFDINAIKLKMAYWLKNQRQRKGKFAYLLVPEFHKDGRALHFHALFKDYKGEFIDLGENHKGRKLLHFKSYTLGFNSAVEIDDINKVSSYVRKYITKDMPQFRDKRRFWSSKGLKKPLIVDNPSDWYKYAPPEWQSENEFGRTLIFLNSSELAAELGLATEDSPELPLLEQEG